MKQITVINFNALRNDEFLGIHSEGLEFAKAITDKDMQAMIANYEKAFNALDNFLDASVIETKAKQAQALDIERNNVYAACRRVAKANREYPDESARETGAQIWKVFEDNPNPIRINQQQSNGILRNIIQGLKGIEAEKLEACGFKVWLDKLETVNNQFLEADMARNTERGQKELDYCRRLRAAVCEAYKLVSMAASVKATSGSEACKQFIESMDGTVILKKQQLNSRRGRTKQRSDQPTTDPATTDQAATAAQPTTQNSETVGVENAA